MSKHRTSGARRRTGVSLLKGGGHRAISVIIPTLNEEKLLAGCLAQFTPEFRERFNIEVIVSDGNSHDNTIGIAASYADKLAVHQDETRRQTISEGRNRGATISEGAVLVFVNADTRFADIYHFFERISIRFSIDPSLAALAVNVRIFPEERQLVDRLFHSFFNNYVRFLNAIGIGAGRGECQIVRRSAFESISGYNKEFAAGEDFDLYNRISEFGKVSYDAKLLIFESPRRYRKYGYPRVYLDWIRNGLATFFSKKASSQVWEEVR